MKKTVNIIGAGLSGCEAAWQLANRGINVNLYEMKSVKKNPVQNLDYFAELVCSNSLRSNDLKNAVGTLKRELELFNSLIIQSANECAIPGGQSLTVDRESFSKTITKKIKNHPNINVIKKEVVSIDRECINIIASGPLTSPLLQQEITNIIGKEYFYFFDAVAPIIKLESINMNICFKKNRYDKGETKDYINCPMNKEQYELFYNELIKAETIDLHLDDETNLKFFEGCMPVEAMAKRGFKTLLYGPLKPAGISNKDGSKNYAIVQLRQDNAKDSLYNLVGFQTNLKFNEQKRIFRLIPGLENAEFIRYGVMHKNNFINSPILLNEYNQLKSNQNIFFVGQITGVEGYVESTSSGLIAALNVYQLLSEKKMVSFPKTTVMGSLQSYIINTNVDDFQPMKANWGIVENLHIDKKIKKEIKKELYSNRAINDLQHFIKLNKFN
ncbi:tRNA (uracil-5-)-methyltransferase Gid [Spiroplasma corruscae]|uniref:Methylenetetrahydrofolate--tRNA-(uracil-5-)-methyltransferase TrmFO n=1 Tax=Spiroplasma corruscae TaxID=216934 RepID=A0A222EPS6_9MOLU|nr:methylenetetrahydrofolate--tRNA-(uracil(54)-C(5))-methyltransferase (FADH(2)-oxidizing) TrmFO [Spiroplasma corruscae]ASP28527.1 tRNA (uracil-5-)-methyltransferase Gid [Spiroplasma corruscae]